MAWQPKGNIRGPQGAAGATGATGAQGVAGAAGEQWYSGAAVPPSGTGNIGDWYINTATSDVYEKTSATVWTLRMNIKGNTGATGSQGPQGATGSQGPAGSTGAQGPKGDQGIQGVQGAAGVGVPAGGVIAAILRKKSATDNDTEWKALAYLQTAVDLSATINGAVARHCGFGATAKITPTATGKVLVRVIIGTIWTTGGANYFSLGSGRYGTGAAPAANAVASGTVVGQTVQTPALGQPGLVSYFEASGILQLTVGTQYWFDFTAQGSNAAAVTTIQNSQVQAIELP